VSCCLRLCEEFTEHLGWRAFENLIVASEGIHGLGVLLLLLLHGCGIPATLTLGGLPLTSHRGSCKDLAVHSGASSDGRCVPGLHGAGRGGGSAVLDGLEGLGEGLLILKSYKHAGTFST